VPVKKNVLNEQSINDVNYEELKRLFPSAVSTNEDGKYIIDPQKLQMSLDPSKAEIKENGYGLNWVGKKEAYHQAFSKNYKILKPLNDDNSKNWDDTGNILIKGDNLDALKILRQNYFESIKMIYIDPPYNTKNDGFVYNDNFSSTTEDTLETLGYEKEYIDYIENIQGAKTHSGWLSFMYPRLLLAKDLLKDDGVIFISIDDNEVAQLKLLCDEVFGGGNFEGHVHWRRRHNQPNDKSKMIGLVAEHILVYSKNKEVYKNSGVGKLELTGSFSNHANDPDPLGDWASKPWKAGSDQGGSSYQIITPTGRVLDEVWMGEEQTFKELLKNKRIIFPKDGDGSPRKKYYKSEREKEGQSANNWWNHDKFGYNQEANDEMTKLFHNMKNIFSNPKPTKLIMNLIRLSNAKQSDIILDFFAGSGTTAHAVMQLNADGGGNRRCISVQIDEPTDKKSEAYKADYKTIFEITKTRIKRAGDLIAKGDIGFRTFEIIEDTKQHIYQMPLEKATQIDMLNLLESPTIDSNEDILYNLLVAEGLPLSLTIETLVADKLYLAFNVAFILGNIDIDTLIENLKDKKSLEYITVYSPNISDDKFTLELESAVGSIGIKTDKLRFRG